MQQKLSGKVAVVTGASKGIGAAIAKHLADDGAAVVVNYSSSKEGADRVVAEIKSQGGKAIAVQANVAKKADLERLFSEAKRAFGALDILVNNAGIYEFMPLENVTEEHFHKQFNLNVLGLILASQEAVKHFGPAGGSIVNIGSVASTARFPTAAVYCATKAGLHSFTQSLRVQLKNTRVQVFEVAPPATETPLLTGTSSPEDLKGVSVMKVEDMVAESIRGLAADRLEIRPGQANQLKFMSRLAPEFILKQMSRSVDRLLAETAE